MNRICSILFPILTLMGGLGWVSYRALPPRESVDGMQLLQFGRIPLADQGRVKPFDTLALNCLLVISGRQTFIDAQGKEQPAIRWLLDVMSGVESPGRDAHRHRVFRIDHPDLLSALGLQARPGLRYAIDEFTGKIQWLARSAEEVDRRKDAGHPLDAFDAKVLELVRKLQLYARLAQLELHVIPPSSGNDVWRPPSGEGADPVAASLERILLAYKEENAQGFNTQVASHRVTFDETHPKEASKLDFETFFNSLEPFYLSSVLYMIAFIFTCLSWMGWTRPLARSAFMLVALTFAVHTFALGARIYISGRPPVTNLYSSAIFIGWGCVLFGLILEGFHPIGVGTSIASCAGFGTLLIAHFLARDGDTFQVLQAVLDTQFWLATHVTLITMGYAAAFLAGLLALFYIGRGVFTRSLTPEIQGHLGRMLYGTLCFAILFSFVGTVLGGLWADDSWGRFWGWDPKENGALMIVLWNAIILHARWGKLVEDRGTAVLAVFGNVVTSWSWFGVNQLGVGLHSYGWTEGVVLALGIFVLSQLIMMAIGMLPLRRWRSYVESVPHGI